MSGELIGLAALVLSIVTAVLTIGPWRQELDVCKRERVELRRRLELITAAIIGTLPREQRIDLLAQLDERIEPATRSSRWHHSRH